jgi:hypothetical protein
MATRITKGALLIEPQGILSYRAESTAGTVIHPILGRSGPDITEAPGGLRTGTLELGFEGSDSEARSAEAENAHRAGGVFSFISDERVSVFMTYVPSGRVERELEDSTRDAWILRIDFQEVTA